jgi:hypothetical protein
MVKVAHTSPEPQMAEPFDWPLAKEAENLLRKAAGEFLERNSFAKTLSERMRKETATDFFEWIDHFSLGPEYEEPMRFTGFETETDCETTNDEAVFAHPRATLPRVLLHRGHQRESFVIALRPEFVADFAGSHNLRSEIRGEPFSRYRRVVVAQEGSIVLEAVERHAYRGFVRGGDGSSPQDQQGTSRPRPNFVEPSLSRSELQAVIKARELWRTRPRQFANDAEGFRVANEILNQVLALIGRDRACQYFFENERSYWQSRNQAARAQKHRQDRLGLGWGNHDHHTFRCSRAHFIDLIGFLLKLGFHKRERFYAGAEAGWGAQILEHPMTGIVVFTDVDLMPEETQVDFSSEPLPPTGRLGTVGLWVGLHGESFLEAGMHHLEARFDFELLRAQLKSQGVTTMAPFSDFEFLRQAFTEGERWPVRRERLETLCSAGLITREQFERFRTEGAIGSHLENLQRHGGFKGFNQKSVSAIIAATDPRTAHFVGGGDGSSPHQVPQDGA